MENSIKIANQNTLPSGGEGVGLREAARQFINANALQEKGLVIAFYGKMGAGKTTFIKALCEELGVEDVITSPTFAIVNEYSLPLGGRLEGALYHFDFYRIKKIEEVYDMGYEDYFYSGNLCLIEWPELIEDLLPENALRVTIEEQPDGSRTITW
jgi:tRNA threonylcarbamoyladenosine biosynthesis protein TsaE